MSNPAFSITFVAPPERPVDYSTDFEDDYPDDREPVTSGRSPVEAGLRWLPKAKQAAQSAGISDEQVRDAMDTPDKVGSDETNPERTVFRRGTLMVVTGRDGIILAARHRRR